MGSPIFDDINAFNQQRTGRPDNGFLGLYQQVRNSPNPNQAMQSLLQNDSRFSGITDYISQNGGDAKTAFYNMAAQKGVDPNKILNLLRSFG